MNAYKMFDSKKVEVIGVSGGWSTIIIDGHLEKKVRNGQLSECGLEPEPELVPEPISEVKLSIARSIPNVDNEDRPCVGRVNIEEKIYNIYSAKLVTTGKHKNKIKVTLRNKGSYITKVVRTDDITLNEGEVITEPASKVVRAPSDKTIKANKDKYVRGLGATAHGSDTFDINDEAAILLRGLSLDDLYEKAGKFMAENRQWLTKSDIKLGDINFTDYLKNKYFNLNSGMKRMNIGNKIRGIISRKNELG